MKKSRLDLTHDLQSPNKKLINLNESASPPSTSFTKLVRNGPSTQQLPFNENSSLVDLTIFENLNNVLEDHNIISAHHRTQRTQRITLIQERPQRNQSRTIISDESPKKRSPHDLHRQRQESTTDPHDQGISLRTVRKTREGKSGNFLRDINNQGEASMLENIIKPRHPSKAFNPDL